MNRQFHGTSPKERRPHESLETIFYETPETLLMTFPPPVERENTLLTAERRGALKWTRQIICHPWLFSTINRSTSLSSVGLPHAYEPNKTILSGWYSWTIFSAMGFNFSSINFLDFINIFNYTANHSNIPHCAFFPPQRFYAKI